MEFGLHPENVGDASRGSLGIEGWAGCSRPPFSLLPIGFPKLDFGSQLPNTKPQGYSRRKCVPGSSCCKHFKASFLWSVVGIADAAMRLFTAFWELGVDQEAGDVVVMV